MLFLDQANELSNSDLYTGYNEYDPLLDSKNLQFDERFQQAVLRSSYGDRKNTRISTGLLTSNRKNRLESRRNTLNFLQPVTTFHSKGSTVANDTARPVTAVRAAGYSRDPLTISGYKNDNFVYNSLFDFVNQKQIQLNNDNQKQDEKFIGTTKIKILQSKIQQIYQESVLASQRSDHTLALKKARDCSIRERSLRKYLNSISSSESPDPLYSNLETMLAVQVNLAIQLTRNKLYHDAIEIYQSILKNRQLYSSKEHSKSYTPERFKCNIGSIYYAEGKYQKAIKFFRMASDQMPGELQDLKMKISRNIAFCYVRMGKYSEALNSFEYNLSERALCMDAFRLLVCNYALRDVSGMKTSFLKLLELKDHLYENASLNNSTKLPTKYKEIFSNDKKFDASSFLGDSFDEDDDELTELNSDNLIGTSTKQINKSAMQNLSNNDDSNLLLLKRTVQNDLLSAIHNQLLKQRNWCILTASKLIAGEIANEIENGFVWCALSIKRFCTEISSDLTQIDDLGLNSSKMKKYPINNQLHDQNPDLIGNGLNSFSFANSNRLVDELIAELQLACAEFYLLKKRKLDSAIAILKVYEKSLSASTVNKRLWTAKCSALTNLAYIHLLKREITYAHRYLDQVLELDHMHVGALVNKGCCFILEGHIDQSRECFSEALLNEPNCVSAIYNLALANKQSGRMESALDLLFRLNSLITENEFCIYQIANIYEQLKDRDRAFSQYEKLLSKVPNDVYLLNKTSDLFDAFAYLNESYRQNPAFIPTLERLAAHYIETKAFEKAINFLKEAYEIQPRKVKWLLMVAACYIRSNNYQQALATYRQIHKLFPQNLDCLKHLFRLTEELNLLDEQIIYAERIAKIEKANENLEKKVQSSENSKHSASSTNSFNQYSLNFQSTRLRNGSALNSANKSSNRPSSKFSLQSDEDSNSLKGHRVNGFSNPFFEAIASSQTISKRENFNDDLNNVMFNLENNQEQRPMTSGQRRHQTSEELANDFTTEELSKFLP